MSLAITGIDANGRITPKGTNVVIPKESAGIGDLIYKSSGGAFIVIGRGTANASSITVNSTSYSLWGCIYGFVAGMAMVCAPTESSGAWLSSGSSSVGPEYSWGTVLMRNGIKCTYAQMNTAQQSSSDSYRGTAGTNVHPTASYDGGVMTESTYNSNTNNVKNHYGSWKEYLRQTLRVSGAPGTLFGAVADGVKVHEFGRWMTAQIVATHGSTAVAAKYCYDYNEGSGTWWLPSMFELGEMMIDEHWDKMNENSVSGWSVPSRGSDRWSCVRFSSGSAWLYAAFGMSYYAGFTLGVTVRPVTLLKLV